MSDDGSNDVKAGWTRSFGLVASLSKSNTKNKAQGLHFTLNVPMLKLSHDNRFLTFFVNGGDLGDKPLPRDLGVSVNEFKKFGQ